MSFLHPLRQVTFNMQRQKSQLINSPGTNIDLSYVIHQKCHNKLYFFTDTSAFKSAPLSTLSFDMKFEICKDRHLHIQKPNVDISDEDSSNSEISILVTTQNTKGVGGKVETALPENYSVKVWNG